jgi:phosphopantothenoylcysteine synthetase/decarboxylase
MNVYQITEAKASSVLFYVAQTRRELAKETLREVIAFAVEEGRKGAVEAALATLNSKVEEDYQRSWWTWEKLERANFDDDYDEDYDDTLTRKYEEGYSDALAMVKRLLEEAGK